MTRQEFAYEAWGKERALPGGSRPSLAAHGIPGAKVIFTADDFGRSRQINAAIVHAYREGLLTSASLMVAGEAADEAVALAREMPTLAVGLHLVVVDGPSVLPASQIPRLVDRHGKFRKDPFRAGVHYSINRLARRELTSEIRAQFERFAETGLPLSHLDGHLHMHAHPSVLKIALPLAEEFGATGIRVPVERLSEAFHSPTGGRGEKIARSIGVGWLGRRCRRILRRRGSRLATTDWVVGLSESGQMTERYVMDALTRIRGGTTEFYFHPTEGGRVDPLGPNPDDLQTLLSRRIAELLRARGLQKATYETILANTADGAEVT